MTMTFKRLPILMGDHEEMPFSAITAARKPAFDAEVAAATICGGVPCAACR